MTDACLFSFFAWKNQITIFHILLCTNLEPLNISTFEQSSRLLTYRGGYAALLAPGIRSKIASAIVTVFMNQSTHYLHTAVGMRRSLRLESGIEIESAIVNVFMKQSTVFCFINTMKNDVSLLPLFHEKILNLIYWDLLNPICRRYSWV